VQLPTNDAKSLAPPLIDSIKAAGLVLVSDVSGSPADVEGVRSYAGRMAVSDRVDGVVRGNGVLTFMDSVDV
jgi:CDK inhibitor PHO81